MGGNLIREARLRARLTQAELAERIGTTQSAIARWEANKSEPSYATVMNAVRAAGFTIDIHLEPDDGSDLAQARRLAHLTPEELLLNHQDVADFFHEVQEAGRVALSA